MNDYYHGQFTWQYRPQEASVYSVDLCIASSVPRSGEEGVEDIARRKQTPRLNSIDTRASLGLQSQGVPQLVPPGGQQSYSVR